MREPELAARIVTAVRAVVPATIPVTVKHRAGWDDRSLNGPEFAVRMVEAGAELITIHGRTRQDGFSGNVRLDAIAAVRAAVPRHIPVVGNGDVKTLDDYRRMKTETGCDAVMIGRSARGNPWLFGEVLAFETGTPPPAPPGIADRRQVWRRHADLVVEYASEKMRLHELRKTLAWYSRGMHGGAELRHRCFTDSDPTAVIAMGEAFFDRLLAREGAQSDLGEIPYGGVVADRSLARHLRRKGEDKACEP
jgi:tRNA-dihydrouridine synthase B